MKDKYMYMDWRPHNWEVLLKKHGVYSDDAFGRVKAEAGADAIIESLCRVIREMDSALEIQKKRRLKK